MTNGERGNGTGETVATGDRALLEQVRRSAADLVAGLSRQPTRLHVRVGEVAIDIEWSEAHPAAAGPATLAQVEPVAVSVPPESEPAGAPPHKVLTAQAVGVFYRAPEPGAKPFVTEGDRIQRGQQVAIIEAMKLMIPVEADLEGLLVEVLKADGESVEYGEPLFVLTDSESG
jgi:acetyl-CoA carboxylase biotin carboxyl carrier protein